jgi:hypothetical protein
MSQYTPAHDMPLEDALREIRTATNKSRAVQIRNDVAYAAMKRQRPQADADACDEAYYAAWGHTIVRQHQELHIQPPVTGYWGD